MPMFKRVAKKRVYKKKAPVAKLSKPMKKAVVKLIEGRAEKKFDMELAQITPGSVVSLVTGPINAYGTLPDVSSFQRILPQIAQGPEVFNRIGNKIRPTSCVLDLTLAAYGRFNGSIDVNARIILVSDKSIKNYTQMNASNILYGSLLDQGQAGPDQYQGLPFDNLRPINTRQFTVHYDKVVRISKATGLNTDSLGSVVGTQTFVSPYQFRTRIKVPFPKELKYDMDSDVDPSNFAPLLSIGYASVDGTSITYNLLIQNWNCTLRYEDS